MWARKPLASGPGPANSVGAPDPAVGSQDHLLEAASASLCPVLCVCSMPVCDGEAGTSVGLWAAEGKAGEGGGDVEGSEEGEQLGAGTVPQESGSPRPSDGTTPEPWVPLL